MAEEWNVAGEARRDGREVMCGDLSTCKGRIVDQPHHNSDTAARVHEADKVMMTRFNCLPVVKAFWSRFDLDRSSR